uniref:Uncharacterized protein n=1 Tax=Sphaerodactylus townsendi TaxID=933632 RepID=A0ACB8EEG7_9SAUR
MSCQLMKRSGSREGILLPCRGQMLSVNTFQLINFSYITSACFQYNLCNTIFFKSNLLLLVHSTFAYSVYTEYTFGAENSVCSYLCIILQKKERKMKLSICTHAQREKLHNSFCCSDVLLPIPFPPSYYRLLKHR